MATTLLQTKLHVPALRPAVITRRRLLAKLDEALPRAGSWQRRLTLISAPAGYGKTTLAASWIARSQIPTAWLTLDAGDNDQRLFLAYLFAGLKGLGLCGDADMALSPARILEDEFAGAETPALVHFLNACAVCERPFALALDDYHLIQDEAIHQAVAYVLTHLPEQMHLLLLTRADPPLPLVRFRGQGQMTEIRQTDLRFTPAEAHAFFAEAMALALPATALDALAERTEGWAAGLQMAALALQRQPSQDPQAAHSFVRDFAGTHRHILDYLLEEVLERQPADVQAFLLQTSILETLSAGLCQAVLAETGLPVAAQEMLEYLEAANLFIVPLDDRRCWYRYHHLFADLLRARLARRQPEAVPGLFRRAAAWYEGQGMLTEAVQAALAAGDLAHVARLAERNALGLMEYGDVKRLAKWLDALPGEAVAGRSWLRLAQGWALAYAGRLPAAEQVAADVEALPNGAGASSATSPTYGHAGALRAYVAWLRGAQKEAVRLAGEALADLPEAERATRCMAATILGNARTEIGDLMGAGRAFEEAVALARQLPPGHLPLFAAGSMAYYLLRRARLRQAAAVCAEAAAGAGEGVAVGRELPALALIYAMWGTVQRHWHQLDEALSHTRRALSLAQQWGQIDMITLSTVNLVGVLAAREEFEEAYAYLQAAHQGIAAMASPWFERILAETEMVVALRQGDLTRAGALLDRMGILATDEFGFDEHGAYQLLASYLLATGDAAAAGRLLARLLSQAEAAGAHGERLKLLVLRAQVAQAQGARREAARSLKRALRLAAPEDFLSPFIAAGHSLRPLLGGPAGQSTPAFTARVLATLGEPEPAPVAGRWPRVAEQPLIEPLSERELDVLRLLGAGRSNREIGLALSISLATVKWHASNLYGKLGVGNRTEAVVRAQQLGLLP